MGIQNINRLISILIPLCGHLMNANAFSGNGKHKDFSPSNNSPWSIGTNESGNAHRYICIITETNACDSQDKVDDTMSTIEKALGSHNDHSVDLISLRVSAPNESDKLEVEHFRGRLLQLCHRVMSLKATHQNHELYNDYKVVINDVAFLNIAIEAKLDGVHVKEKDVMLIPDVRDKFKRSRSNENDSQEIIIGTSSHSIDSGVFNWQQYQPNYMFVGTCYLTKSHPEKNSDDLEGPRLPGEIKQKIQNILLDMDEKEFVNTCSKMNRQQHILQSPIIFAIGGIEVENCFEPVNFGADGVAVIRSVMQASNPAEAVANIKKSMN